jgi:hypothetical protein
VLPLGDIVRARGTRGLALARSGTRAYVSVRIRETSIVQSNRAPPTLFNSAIAVVEVGPTELSLRAYLEVGEELGKPALLERDGRRLLYAPDLRTGRIWILDVTTDDPIVVAMIEGRGTASFEGSDERANLLRTPFQILFPPPIGGVQLGVITNFGDSTMTILDVTSPDPRAHRIVGRYGRALSSDGVEEVP